MPVHNFVRLWCILLRNAAVQHPGKFARSCVGNTAAIRPTSLCMRLFGNVLGAFVIMELIKLVVPVFVPAIFSLYFDLFDGLIQTYVFVFLTSLFMKETME